MEQHMPQKVPTRLDIPILLSLVKVLRNGLIETKFAPVFHTTFSD